MFIKITIKYLINAIVQMSPPQNLNGLCNSRRISDLFSFRSEIKLKNRSTWSFNDPLSIIYKTRGLLILH